MLIITLVITCGYLLFNNSKNPFHLIKLPSKSIEIVYVDTADSIALSALVEKLIESNSGYSVDRKKVKHSTAYIEVTAGYSDLFVGAKNSSVSPYYSKYSDQFDVLAKVYDGMRYGLAVPDYTPAKTIADLAKMQSSYERNILTIDKDFTLYRVTQNAIVDYELIGYKIVPVKEKTLVESLISGLKQHRSFIVGYWSLGNTYAKWPLRILEDPKKVFGDSFSIQIIARKEFAEDHPAIAAMLSRIHLDRDQFQGLINALDNAQYSPDTAAAKWIKENQSLIQEWLNPQVKK